MYPWGLPEPVRADDSSSNSSLDAEVEDIKGRLEFLEKSSRRIEVMLGKLCANLDVTPKTPPQGEVGTLKK